MVAVLLLLLRSLTSSIQAHLISYCILSMNVPFSDILSVKSLDISGKQGFWTLAKNYIPPSLLVDKSPSDEPESFSISRYASGFKSYMDIFHKPDDS